MVSFPPQGSGGGGSGGGAPTDATYLTTSANATLSAEVLLSAAVDSDTLANRAAAGTEGKLFYATDLDILFRDNGSAWKVVGGGPHYGVFQKLDDDGLLSGLSVLESSVNGATPSTFDATTLATGATINYDAGGILYDFGANTGSTYGYYHFGSSKTKVLIIAPYQNGGSNNITIGVDESARADTESPLDGYYIECSYVQLDVVLGRRDSGTPTQLATEYDLIRAVSSNNAIAAYFDSTTPQQISYAYGGGMSAYEAATGTDSNHGPFNCAYLMATSGATWNPRIVNPIIIMGA